KYVGQFLMIIAGLCLFVASGDEIPGSALLPLWWTLAWCIAAVVSGITGYLLHRRGGGQTMFA
ncbi:hypothetical protein N8083_01295, partial [Candidatus Pacebacteria bacterium]|nr:hypothetical protein [Candidatus Paceibacterota bacterium]